MKLILGTVQFGMLYGINNINGIPSEKELIDILKLAKENSISYLDSSISYGDSEKRIGILSPYDFNVITKSRQVTDKEDLIDSLSLSLRNLNKSNIYGYLIHDVENLIYNIDLWNTMKFLKTDKLVKKIGYSIYTPTQLNILLDKKIIPDIIQIPYSLLDRKFEKYFHKLKEMNVEIHARSVFLQGLYHMSHKKIPKKLNNLKKHINSLDELCRDMNITIPELALNFVHENNYIDKVIIGVDSKNQLLENINFINNWDSNNNQMINSFINKINVKEEHLLNPVNWI